MANVLLTNRCNLRCAYCFAQERLRGNRHQTMSLADVEKVISFLKRSDHPLLRLMGGEPTLHPQFPRIVEMALAESMRVDVLSNATWPGSYNEFFARISPHSICFLLNIDHPDSYPHHLWERIWRNVAAVAQSGNVTLSFNIFQPEPRYEYILELVRNFRINRVRMSFSLPILGAQNAYLQLEQYAHVAPFVMEFSRRLEDLGVDLRLDNAVPLCMFNYQEVGELLVKGILDFQRNARCSPVLDIGPDLTVWCCFCLSKLWTRHLDDFQNLQEIYAYYASALRLYQGRVYPMDKCYTCHLRELWGCQGGCLAYTILKHGELPFGEVPASSSDPWDRDIILALAPGVEVRHYDLPHESYGVCNPETGAEVEVDPSFRPLLMMLNGQHSAKEAIRRFLEIDRPPDPHGALTAFVDKAKRKVAEDFLLALLHQRFLVEVPQRSSFSSSTSGPGTAACEVSRAQERSHLL